MCPMICHPQSPPQTPPLGHNHVNSERRVLLSQHRVESKTWKTQRLSLQEQLLHGAKRKVLTPGRGERERGGGRSRCCFR